MIRLDILQKSPEWYRARLGVATASNFHKIITPTGKPSAQAAAYANQLIAEILTGESAEAEFKSFAMERGTELEAEAAQSYAFVENTEIHSAGFTLTDDMKFGASLDRLVGKTGAVEIKCPLAKQHVENMLEGAIDPAYIPQVQGQIYVCNLDYVDWYSYYPTLSPVCIRTYRDKAYCEKLDAALSDFSNLLDTKIKTLLTKKLVPAIPPRPVVAMVTAQTQPLTSYLMAG